MFFLSNRTCRTGLSRFGKLTFPKSADSQFLKTADCDFSEICRNKVTAYIKMVLLPLLNPIVMAKHLLKCCCPYLL